MTVAELHVVPGHTFWISLLFLPLDSEGIVHKEAQFTARASEFYQLRRNQINEEAWFTDVGEFHQPRILGCKSSVKPC